MAFLKKDDLLATAEEYGIDIEGMTFPQQQGKVLRYLTDHGLEPVHLTPEPIKQMNAQDAWNSPETFQSKQPPHPQPQFVETPQIPVLITGKAKRVQLDRPQLVNDQLKGKRLMLSPEIRYSGGMIYRYEEDLGEDLEVEEVFYNGETLDQRHVQGAPGQTNGISGTYKVSPKRGSKVTAMSSVPLTNVGIYWDFDAEGLPVTPFPVATFEGRKGYLYSHATLPNVLEALRDSGYYQEFKQYLQDEPNIFYLAGSVRAVDMDFCEWMMGEIEERARFKRGSGVR